MKPNKQPGLLGEYPGAAAVNALRGLLPLPLPNTKHANSAAALLHKPVKPQRTSTASQGNGKPKSRKIKPGRVVKERRDSTTESDEATGNPRIVRFQTVRFIHCNFSLLLSIVND